MKQIKIKVELISIFDKLKANQTFGKFDVPEGAILRFLPHDDQFYQIVKIKKEDIDASNVKDRADDIFCYPPSFRSS